MKTPIFRKAPHLLAFLALLAVFLFMIIWISFNFYSNINVSIMAIILLGIGTIWTIINVYLIINNK